VLAGLEQKRGYPSSAGVAGRRHRGNGPEGASFRNADELEALLLQAGPPSP